MNNADFIYNYAKLYHQYNVKAVLIRENWEDKDCDAKYADYMQEYIRIKRVFNEKGLSDDKIKDGLSVLKRERIKFIYDYLYKNLTFFLETRNGKLTPEKKETLESRLNNHRDPEDVNFDYLYEIRRIEEEEF